MFDHSLSSSLFLTRSEGGTADQTSESSDLGFVLGGSHSLATLRHHRLTVDWDLSRSEAEVNLRPIQPPPGVIIPPITSNLINAARLRLTGEKSLARKGSLQGWLEWSRRAQSDSTDDDAPSTETLLATARFDGRKFSFSLNGGESRSSRGVAPDDSGTIPDFHGGSPECSNESDPSDGPEIQIVFWESGSECVRISSTSRGPDTQSVFWGAAASWNPFRFLRLWSDYSLRGQQSTFQDFDEERARIALQFTLGRLTLTVDAWRNEYRVEASPVRTNRGVSLHLRRHFAGWLPIVSAPRARGMIR